MTMTEAELKEFLDANKADIQQAVKAKMIDRLLATHQWEISSQITAIVNEFITNEIAPEVKKFLAEQKGPIIEAACAGASEIGNALARAMIAHTAKNLDSESYKFRGVMKALFE
jgi:Na+-transporting NADH:ubiquinone oxidoreductase subunit NqrD